MDPTAAMKARARARKEQEDQFYNAELEKMAKERAQMASIADRIVVAITKAEARNNEFTIQDMSSADKMDELISKSNATRMNSLETLKDLQESFQEMKQSSNYEKLMEEIGPIVSINEDEGTSTGPESEGKEAADGEETSFSIVPIKTLASEAKEQKYRLAEATTRLNKIFETGHKEYNDLVLSMTSSFDDGAQAVDADIRVDGDDTEVIQEALIPMLQKKMAQLSASLEMTTLKSEALTVQLIADKAMFVEKESKMQRTIEALDIKLQVATNKKRFGEQIERDPNMVGGIVSQAEYDEAVRERNEAREETKKAKKEVEDTQKEFAALKTRAYEAERTKADNEAKITQLEKDVKNATKAAEAMKEVAAQLAETEQKLTVVEAESAGWKQKFEDGSAKLEADIKRELSKVLVVVRGFDALLDKEEARMNLQLDKQTARLYSAKEGVEQLKTAMGEMQQTLVSAQEELETASLASASAAGGLGELQAENDKLKAELEDVSRQLGLLTEQSAVMEEQMRAATAASDAGSVQSNRSRRSARSVGGPDDDRQPMTAERSNGLIKDLMSDAERRLQSSLKRAGLSDGEVAAAVTEHSKAVSRKALAFGKKLFEMGIDDEEIDEILCAHVSSLWESVEKLVVDSKEAEKAAASSGAAAAAAAAATKAASHDDDDISVLTAESVPFDAGEDDEEDEDYRNRELTDEERDLLEQMKTALRSGTLADLGTIKKENFDRLRDKGFGGDDLIELTIMEHNIRYDDGGDDDDDDEEQVQQAGGNGVDPTEAAKRSRAKASSEDRRKRMQINMMTMLQEQTLVKVIDAYDFSELSTFKTNSEKDIRLLRSFSALKALKHYYDGGNFMDVLTTHRDIIDRAIEAKGGWKAALEEVKGLTHTLDKDSLAKTDHWPDFFRVKVLEFYKRALQSQQERFQLTMDLFQTKSMEKSKRDAARLEEQKEKTRLALLELEELKKKKKKPLRSVKNVSRGSAGGETATAPPTSAPVPEGAVIAEPSVAIADETPVEPPAPAPAPTDKSTVDEGVADPMGGLDGRGPSSPSLQPPEPEKTKYSGTPGSFGRSSRDGPGLASPVWVIRDGASR
jgi:hypothetical protein